MGYQLVSNGDVPVETYFNLLMKQTVIVCTSGTRPSSPPEGMTVYETDTDRYSTYNGSAWVTYGQISTGTFTPSLTAGTTNPTLGTGSTSTGRYTLWNGKICTYWGQIAFGTASVNAGSGQYFISLPFTSNAATNITTGCAMMRDSSAGTITPGSSYLAASVTTLSMVTASGTVASASPWVWAASDYLTWNITYEIA